MARSNIPRLGSLSILTQLTLYTFFHICLATMMAQANVILPTGKVLSSFDIDWSLRRQRDFNISGVIHNSINFSSPLCTAQIQRTLNATDIVHVHLPWFQSANCKDIGSVVMALTRLLNGSNTLLISLLSEQEAGAVFSTPWGDPSVLDAASFNIALAPLSTAVSLWNFTNNYTKLPTVQITSDMGPWNDHIYGFATKIYYIILTVMYVGLLVYGIYLQVDAYRHSGVFSWNIKTWVFIFNKVFISAQIIAIFLPIYPNALAAFFYWYSFLFGFAAYTLVLLTWVRVVSHDRNAKTAMSDRAVKVTHGFSYSAIVYVAVIVTFCALGSYQPQNAMIVSIRNALFNSFPFLVIIQATVFMVYGLKLIRVLKTFTMTPEKRDLLRRMTILLSVAIACFLLSALMMLIYVVASTSLMNSWICRVFRDLSTSALTVMIFTNLNASKRARLLTAHDTGTHSRRGTKISPSEQESIQIQSTSEYHNVASPDVSHEDLDGGTENATLNVRLVPE